MKMQASNVKSLKNDNRALILNEIRKCPCSRAQLADKTSLTRSAVTMIVQELMAEGQLKETSSLQSDRGRRQILLDIVEDHKLALGLALHRREISTVLTDLRGKPVDKNSRPTSAFANREAALAWSFETMKSMIHKHKLTQDKLVGIGISSPGPLDRQSGRILEPIDFPLFQNFDITEEVASWQLFKASESASASGKSNDSRTLSSTNTTTGSTVEINLDNNAVLMAMREFYNGTSPIYKYKHILFVTISRGIGSCLISDGQIYRGLGGFAGELGHTSIDAAGRPCSCGNYGCIEKYATLDALKAFFGFESYDIVVDLAYNGISRYLAIVEQIAEWLTTALVNAVNLFDLDAIVLYGELNYRPQLLTDMIEKKVRQRSLISRAHEIKVFASSFDDKTAAEASTAGIIDAYFKQKLAR
jgi:predicted NBD/HSP70 family sugar kinase